MKPMSSMRSASSRTNTSRRSSRTRPWPIRSSRRPGVATRMSTPRASALHLLALADAAEDHGVAELEIAAVGGEAVADLRRQLAGRGQHQDAAGLRPGRADVVRQALQDRQRERRRLAGAGLCAAQQVAAGEQVGNRLGLDRRRRGVVLGADGALDRRAQAEIGKGGHVTVAFWMAGAGSAARVGSGHPARGRGSLSVHRMTWEAAGGWNADGPPCALARDQNPLFPLTDMASANSIQDWTGLNRSSGESRRQRRAPPARSWKSPQRCNVR